MALARSFMRAAPILVLDEPTSALDAQAEYELFARLGSLAEGRTAGRARSQPVDWSRRMQQILRSGARSQRFRGAPSCLAAFTD